MSTASRLIAACAALGAAFALPGAQAGAASPRYTYAELGFVHTDIGNGVDGDGFGLNASYALLPGLHVIAGVQGLDLGDSVDATLFNLGAGVNAALRPGLDAVGRISYVHANVDAPGPGSHNEDGFQLDVLGRMMINPRLELNAGVRYLDLDTSNTSFRMGAQYEVTGNLTVGGELAVSGDGVSVFVGGRLYFNPPFTLRRAGR